LRPRLIILNLALVGGLAAVGYQARLEWQRSQAERKAHLNVPVKAPAVPPPAAAPKPETASPIRYEDVAKRNLFSKDRSPDVIVEPPKPVEVKKMPPLPVVYGVMALPSGVRAIMAELKGNAGRGVREGDRIGEFQVAALDPEKVVFQWNGERIERRIEDLIDRSGPARQDNGGNAPAPRGPAAPPPPQAQQPANAPPRMGPATGENSRACVPGENSPPGTVLDGYHKTVVQTPFGPMGCRWEK